MNYKEAQEHLTEAKRALKNCGEHDVVDPNYFSLKSIANSLLVIASVVADVEFKDADHVGCMEGKENEEEKDGSV